jgi:hypothetical protein
MEKVGMPQVLLPPDTNWQKTAFPPLFCEEVNGMERAKIWRGPLRCVLIASIMLVLALAVFVIASSPAHAATRQELRPCPSLTGCGQQGNTCYDPQQITLDCLNYIVSDTLPGNSSLQNPIANGSALFFLTSPADTVGQATVQKLWSIMLIAVDICGALMIITSGLYIMVGGTVFRMAKAVETIPGVLLTLVAAHISLIFIGTLLGLNNAVVYDLYQWAESNVKVSMQSGITTVVSVPSPDGQVFCAARVRCTGPRLVREDALATIQITPQNLDFTDMLQNISSLSDMLSLIIKIMSLMLLAQVIIRLFFIDLYIVLAPLGISCWALPGRAGQPLTRLWVRGFVSTVLVQFVQVTALIIVEVMLPPLFIYFYNHGGSGVLQTTTLVEVFNIALLWFVFRVPALFETAPMRTLIAAGQAMSAAVGGVVTTQIAMLQTGITGGLGLVGGILGFFR